MGELMRVVNLRGNEAVLEPLELEGCANCIFNSVCNMDPDKQKVRALVEGLDLKIGDIVEVRTPKAVATRLSFVVYTMPLLIFISLLVMFKYFRYSDEISFILSIVPVALYYMFLRKLDQRIAARYKPKVVAVRNSGGLFNMK